MQAASTVGQAITTAHTVSRGIRTRQANISPDIKEAFHAVFVARQALAAKLAAQILAEGEPEQWADTTPVCRHFRHRHARIGDNQEKGLVGEPATAQVHTHESGVVIRFWVLGPGRTDIRVRDLILLALPKGEQGYGNLSGYEVWLDDGDKIFPHEGGKYADAGRVILRNMVIGR